MDLAEYPLRHTISTGIRSSQALDEWEAAHAAGLDLYRWDQGEYPAQFMAKVLAWHSRHRELEMHRDDAVSRAMEKRYKPKG